MIIGDMHQKREAGRRKVMEAIKLHGGTTLLATGVAGDDARMALAAVEAGAKLVEPNHPAIALARGHKGVTNMHDAENVRHEITLEQMAEVDPRGAQCGRAGHLYHRGRTGHFRRGRANPVNR